MPGKPLTKVLMVMGFQATFILFGIFLYCLNFLHGHLLFYILKTECGGTHLKERKRERYSGKEKEERRKKTASSWG